MGAVCLGFLVLSFVVPVVGYEPTIGAVILVTCISVISSIIFRRPTMYGIGAGHKLIM